MRRLEEIGESGIPGVVSITRILDRSAFQPIESGPFNVRIILTEEPKGGLTTDLIEVVNGSATALTKGLSLKGEHRTLLPVCGNTARAAN